MRAMVIMALIPVGGIVTEKLKAVSSTTIAHVGRQLETARLKIVAQSGHRGLKRLELLRVLRRVEGVCPEGLRLMPKMPPQLPTAQPHRHGGHRIHIQQVGIHSITAGSHPPYKRSDIHPSAP